MTYLYISYHITKKSQAFQKKYQFCISQGKKVSVLYQSRQKSISRVSVEYQSSISRVSVEYQSRQKKQHKRNTAKSLKFSKFT